MSADHPHKPLTGRRSPPATSRFRKGQSGNPRGRPKGRHREVPYEAVLGQLVTVRETGTERRVTAAEAFLLHLAKRGLEGDGAAARAATRILDEVRDQRLVEEPLHIIVTWQAAAPGSVNSAMRSLRMAKLFDAYRDSAHVLLEPWIVQLALEWLGDRRLSPDEQRTVVNATRVPHRVRWPSWWTEREKKLGP